MKLIIKIHVAPDTAVERMVEVDDDKVEETLTSLADAVGGKAEGTLSLPGLVVPTRNVLFVEIGEAIEADASEQG